MGQLAAMAGSSSCCSRLQLLQLWNSVALEEAARKLQQKGRRLFLPCLIPWHCADWM